MSQQGRSTRPPANESKRGDPRKKLLDAAIDIFGRYGFEGATTRALADAAGVNLQAIPYYFGGKEGLYLAAAEHIASLIAAHTADVRTNVRSRLETAGRTGESMDRAEAEALLIQMLQRMVVLFLSEEAASWARFIIREQIEPTEAFQHIFNGVMKPTLDMVGSLVAVLLGENADSEHVKLRTVAMVGSVMIFRTAHAAALAQLGWPQVGPQETDKVRSLAAELVASLARSGDAS